MYTRISQSKDLAAIRQLHEDTFGEPEGEAVARLTCDLLTDDTAQPLLSLVAEEGDQLVGHVLFTPVRIEGHESLTAYILAPLAVTKSFQCKGIGTQLIRQGLDLLKQQGADLVLVLGDPKYYSRAGFHTGHGIEAPYPLPYPEAWQVLELRSGALVGVSGVARCAAPLMAPEYW